MINKMNEFIQRFTQICDRYANHLAILVNNDEPITYSSLYEQVLNYSNKLKSYGVQAGSLIVIEIEKSSQYIVALLAVWMCNAAFVPINSKIPKNRKDFIFKQSNPNLHIMDDLSIKVLHSQINYNKNLAYVFFTSGSTGQPKGVMVSHDGIVNFLDAQIDLFKIDSESRSFFYLSTHFDASISDIGTCFLSGAALYIQKSDDLTLAVNLPSILEKNQITHIDLPPSMLSFFDIHQMPKSLSTIIIGGEVCPSDIIKHWSAYYRLINVYGPTEATVCTSMSLTTPEWDEPCIGDPISNMEYHILDTNRHAVPLGKSGELYISGIGLALGYINNDKLTQQKFITMNNKRFYSTGDWVKQSKQGKYIYLGRIDRQIKIRGQLVAPEEIEAALNAHALVSCAGVVMRNTGDRKQLVAFVEGSHISIDTLKAYLSSQLPKWMIPSHIIVLKTIPKNTTGKINYTQLETIDINDLSDNLNLNAINSDPTSKALQLILKDVLRLKKIPALDLDLFNQLGCDSFSALVFTLKAEAQGIIFPVNILNEKTNLKDLVAWIKNKHSYSSINGMSTDLLKQDAKPEITIKSLDIANSKDVFLTGATGFLGIYLLKELLLQTDYHVTCLVRSNDEQNAMQRILRIAEQFQINISNHLHRIHVLLGDLSLPQLGLNDLVWHECCSRFSNIYHCGAWVNNIKSYQDLKATNLIATKEIVKMASSITKKRIHYISTLSVFVASDQNTGICMENDMLDKTELVYGGYAQSKWAAEYYLQQIPKDFLDINILRLGLITGDSKTGQCAAHDYLALFVRGIIDMGRIPIDHINDIYLDATPVDYASKAIVFLSLEKHRKTYHIANQKKFSLRMVIHSLQEKGITLENTDLSMWINSIKHSPKSSAAFMALCRLLPNDGFDRYRTMDLFQATDVIFDQENTIKGLLGSGISCPDADDALLNKYITYILKSAV